MDGYPERVNILRGRPVGFIVHIPAVHDRLDRLAAVVKAIEAFPVDHAVDGGKKPRGGAALYIVANVVRGQIENQSVFHGVLRMEVVS